MAYKQNPGRGAMQKTGRGIPKGMTSSPIHQDEKVNPWEVTSQETTTREGIQDGVEGMFTDVTTGEQRSTITSGGKQMPDDKWKKFVKDNPDWKKNRTEDRSNVESSFAPNPSNPSKPVEKKPTYTGFDISQATATTFGAKSTRIGRGTEADAKHVINRSRGVQGIDRINGDKEQALVIGIKNQTDWDDGQKNGLGYLKKANKREMLDLQIKKRDGELTKEQWRNSAVGLREKHKLSLKNNWKTKMSLENQERFAKSHDTIYNRTQSNTLSRNKPIKISKNKNSVTKIDREKDLLD